MNPAIFEHALDHLVSKERGFQIGLLEWCGPFGTSPETNRSLVQQFLATALAIALAPGLVSALAGRLLVEVIGEALERLNHFYWQ